MNALSNVVIKQFDDGEFNREGVFIEGIQLHYVYNVKVDIEMDNTARITVTFPCNIKIE